MKDESHTNETGNPYDHTDSEGVDDGPSPSEVVDRPHDVAAKPIGAAEDTKARE
jgi:hypothetical protein